MRLFFSFSRALFPVLLLAAPALANEPPVVQLLTATPYAGEESTISYVLYDPDDDVDAGLHYEIYAYPDGRLGTVDDIRTFATMIADQQDMVLDIGTGDFGESAQTDDVQTYTWDDPGRALQNRGFAPSNRFLPGSFNIYLVADDGVNEPVYAVSEFKVNVHRDAATAVAASSWGLLKLGRR